MEIAFHIFQGGIFGTQVEIVSLMWLEKQSVHVGQLHFVVVEEDEFADAAASEHLGRDAAHTPDADHRHATGEMNGALGLVL